MNERVGSIGETILTMENRVSQDKTCPSDTWPNKNLTWTDLRSNSGLRRERPTTRRL